MFRWSESIRILCKLAVCPAEQINVLHAAPGKNTFAHLPGESKLFNMKAGKREATKSSGWRAWREKRRAEEGRSVKEDQMGNGGTEPDRDRSVLRIDETHEETGIKKNVRTVSEIVFVERTNQ